jgi:N-hydroxyarylamine O-acetyltransferase
MDLDLALADAYLHRLGLDRRAWPDPVPTTIDVLADLQLRHLRTVPFENLSIHLGEEIVLAEERLVEKITGAGRGGFCYELNGAFGALLTALGFEVTLLAARVHGTAGRLGIPYDHLGLRVRTGDGAEWLTDVGFGTFSHRPLALGEPGEQRDPGGRFRIAAAGPGGADLDVFMNGEASYRLETRARELDDFVAGAWWHSTSPASHFTRSLVCSRLTGDGGRITLSGRTLTTTGPGGTKEERELGTDEEVLAVYRERFGIVLDCVPTVRNPA